MKLSEMLHWMQKGAIAVLIFVTIPVAFADETSARLPSDSTRNSAVITLAASDNSTPCQPKASDLPEPQAKQPNTTIKRVYEPIFLPREVQLNGGEIDLIRDAVTKQIVSYHLSLARKNDTYASYQVVEEERWATKARYDKWATEHTQGVFESHSHYTQIIFWMVILIVASGLALTWYQFIQDSSAMAKIVSQLLNGKISVDTKNTIDATALTNLVETLRAEQSLELGKEGMRMKTRVLGLITLLMSMGFFYLYLWHVYPVNIKDTVPSSQTTTALSNQSK